MSEEQTMVQKAFAQIGERFDGIEKLLKREKMPYDVEVEYLESTGTQYIDTGGVRGGQTGYLFDKVSKQLFGNSGTGTFILGPDKA